MKLPGRYYVYIIRSNDNSYYVGVTNDIDRRFCEHAEGRNHDCYTIDRRPLTLVYAEQYRNINEAISREKQLKNWSRKKKEALIRGDFKTLEYHAMNTVKKQRTSADNPSTGSG